MNTGIFITVSTKNKMASVFIVYRYNTAPSPRYILAFESPLKVSFFSESLESLDGTSFIVLGFAIFFLFFGKKKLLNTYLSFFQFL